MDKELIAGLVGDARAAAASIDEDGRPLARLAKLVAESALGAEMPARGL